jgi:hypothetical protein
MRLLGTIVRLQYQRDHLKSPGPFGRQFSPANIVSTDHLHFTPEGVEAGTAAEPIYDAHHMHHPRSRNRGDNGISIGFTSHYAAMRERLGDRLVDGIAGENILIEHTGMFREADFAGGLMVETIDGPIGISQIKIAAPCVEYSRFAMDYPADEAPDRRVTDTLVFLNLGMRGFYATMEASATIRVGDTVYFRD